MMSMPSTNEKGSDLESAAAEPGYDFLIRGRRGTLLAVILVLVLYLVSLLTSGSEIKPSARQQDKYNDDEWMQILEEKMFDGDSSSLEVNHSSPFYPGDSGKEGLFWPAVSDEHWDYMPRVFREWNLNHSWCQTLAENDIWSLRKQGGFQTGLIFVKVHKAASSTLAGVNLRIAHRHGSEGVPCLSFQHHEDSRNYRGRDLNRSFMYSSIRDPASRALSWVYYTMSNKGRNLSDDKEVVGRLWKRGYIQNGLNDSSLRNVNESGAQVGYMHTGPHLPNPLWKQEEPDRLQNLTLARQRVEQVMQQYDFIVVMERLQESLVVLQLLLHLETSDILYLPSKISGQYSYIFNKPRAGCYKLQKLPNISVSVKAFLSSPAFYAANYEDYLLYKAANKSLDLTIEWFGRDNFEKALSTYQLMMKEALECEKEAIFPCSPEGIHRNQTETNCYVNDWGCGYPCLDRKFGTVG